MNNPQSGPFGLEISDEWINGLADLPHEVVILPEALKADTGIYRDELINFAKTLRADGVDAGYYHGVEHRTWSGRKGDPLLIPIVIALSANVATGAATIAVSRWLEQAFPKTSIRLRVIHKRRADGHSARDSFKASGTGPEVAELYRIFEKDRSDGDR